MIGYLFARALIGVLGVLVKGFVAGVMLVLLVALQVIDWIVRLVRKRRSGVLTTRANASGASEQRPL